jgi:predicted DNA-binding transcriptional regulator AlpA
MPIRKGTPVNSFPGRKPIDWTRLAPENEVRGSEGSPDSFARVSAPPIKKCRSTTNGHDVRPQHPAMTPQIGHVSVETVGVVMSTNADSHAIEAAAKAAIASQDRACAAARLGVHGDFVRMPQLARALGISANSIRAQMRSGTFPIPHRRIGKIVVVSLDAYLDWLKRADGPSLR